MIKSDYKIAMRRINMKSQMTGRERLLTALNNQKPDRLPCQVHNWMGQYLHDFLKGADQYEAYAAVGMEPVIYWDPTYIFDPKDLENWDDKTINTGKVLVGATHWLRTIATPKGDLTERGAYSGKTGWTTEYLIKSERDFELWHEFIPVPVRVDWTEILEIKKRLGETGIVRGGCYGFGQGSPWQSFSGIIHNNVGAILATFDKPQWVHFVLESMAQKVLRVLDISDKIEHDVVETGGGAGSSTVISPALHHEFCLPYDRQIHAALHSAGTKSVYHLCGGLMPLLETVVENGADGLETMTPPEMGGDCDLTEATRRVGDKLFFIGGFDQNAGFERGNPQLVKEMVYRLHEACPDGGYICCPSDHFFTGDVENIRAFAEAARECVY